mgnify:CR=1 FL=1
MKKRLWRLHTGSAPGCQDTPRATVSYWFQGQRPLVKDARDCFNNLVDTWEMAEADDEEHRCFSRREYVLDLADVTNIIRDLKAEYDNAGRKS